MTMKQREGYWLDLGLMPYEPAFVIQENVCRHRMNDQLGTTVIVQENQPVFTIGRTGSRSNILASENELRDRGIQVLEVNRGGDVTYHGPGQLIVSPIFYLGDIGMNANEYFHRLEDVLISILSAFGINAGKKEGYPGAWCGDEKIAAIGIAVKHGYTFHGFSLNVNLDISPFHLINPCGVIHMPVTSMSQMLGRDIEPGDVRPVIKNEIAGMFGFDLIDVSLESLPGIGTVCENSNDIRTVENQETTRY